MTSDEQIERAAKALHDMEWEIGWEHIRPEMKESWRVSARAALEAALSATPDIDAALDSINPRWMPGTARIKSMYKERGQWRVEVAKPGGTGTGFTDEDVWQGTGPTRMDAIRNAVATARKTPD